jgi:hypothetical protein
MGASQSKSLPAIGFLTVIEIPDQGLVGGYLVLNAAARPLEFHCTTPVRANRAQEILYGPTLRPYLYGEQIGKTLLCRSKCQPLLAATDVPEVLAARDFVSLPIVLLLPTLPPLSDSEDPTPRHSSTQGERPVERAATAGVATIAAPSSTDKLVEFSLGGQNVAVGTSFPEDPQTVKQVWQSSLVGFDLREPFDRIREAIDESQGASR